MIITIHVRGYDVPPPSTFTCLCTFLYTISYEQTVELVRIEKWSMTCRDVIVGFVVYTMRRIGRPEPGSTFSFYVAVCEIGRS